MYAFRERVDTWRIKPTFVFTTIRDIQQEITLTVKILIKFLQKISCQVFQESIKL